MASVPVGRDSDERCVATIYAGTGKWNWASEGWKSRTTRPVASAAGVPMSVGGVVEWCGEDGEWSDPANWADGVVPSEDDHAVIGKPVSVTIPAGVAPIRFRGGSLNFRSDRRP